MKKALFFLAALFIVHFANAQSFTINNTTSCSYSFFIIGFTPSCGSTDQTSVTSLSAHGSISYSSISKAPWNTTPIPTGLQFSEVQMLDCSGAGGPLVGSTPCSTAPSSAIGTSSSCTCSPYTVTFSVDPFGNVTVTIS